MLIPRLVGRLGSGPRLVGWIGSGVRISASFQKKARLVGRLGSGPRLVADMADVVFTHAPQLPWPLTLWSQSFFANPHVG